ncbi:MAG: hypothetical protein ACI9A7_001729 [Cyclobacteriaceae bacterium]|jgi:hypothetical protein
MNQNNSKPWLSIQYPRSIDFLQLLVRVIAFFFLVGILMSFPLWIPTRDIPLLPLYPIHSYLAPMINWVALVSMICSLGLIIWRTKKEFVWIFMLSLAIILSQDQLRWQPWVYLYSFLIIPFSISNDISDKGIITYLRLVIIAVYLWSGIHKMNPHFANENFQFIIDTYFGFLPMDSRSIILNMGYFIPLIEILTAIFFLIPKTRKFGVYIAIIMHLLIIVHLSPLGIDSNTIVIPWNFAMIFIVIILFSKIRIASMTPPPFRRYWALYSLLFIMYFGPVLNSLGMWDHYLSFSLYSNKAPHFYIASEYNSFGAYNQSVVPFIREIAPSRGKGYVDVNAWCMSVLHVPFYPEERVFHQLTSFFCATDPNPDKLLFVTVKPNWNSETVHSFSCE